MRKINRLILALTVALILILVAGCAKVNITVDVNQDGTGSYEGIIAISETLVQGQDVKSVFENQMGIDFDELGDDVTVNDYEEDGYVGVRILKEIKNADDLEEAGSGLSISISNDEKKTLKISGDVLANSASEEYNVSEMMSSLNVEMLFTIKLPNASISNNATSVEDGGKTLIWDLTKQSQIELVADLNQGGGIVTIYIIIGVVALLAILVAVLVINKKKKANECNNECENGSKEVVQEKPETDVERHVRETVEKYKNL